MFKWLILLIIYLPFQIALNPGAGFDLSSIRVFILALFIAWLYYIVKNKQIFSRLVNEPVRNLQGLGLVFFIVLAAISLLFAENFMWGVRKIVYFLSILPMFWLVYNLADTRQRQQKIVKYLFISGVGIGLIGLIQFLAQFIFSLERVYDFWSVNILPVFSGFNLGSMIMAYPSWLVNISGETLMRAFSLFSDPHVLAFCLGLIIPLAFVYGLIKQDRRIVFITLALLFFVLGLTFARGAYFAAIGSFLIMAWLIYRLGMRQYALVLVLALFIFIIPLTPIAERFYSSFDLTDGSNMGRLDMWQQAGHLGLANLFSGIGLGNYALSLDARYDYRNPATAHSFFLDLFSEMGIIAVIIWLIILLGSIWQIYHRIKGADVEYGLFNIGLIGSLSYFFIHSVFETAIYSPTVFSQLLIILALAAATAKIAKGR